ncbi:MULTISPECIES: inorganic phosphate transporter [Bacillaceae]|uniref:Anion permease n=1 Tax=Metabacillus endolithicus TaxID=1535204 RepID=A0ABW5BVK4_9BACI|nr:MULTISPECIES: inorganic phosphate transporter [Bacillaceae]PGT86601.1 anion permease [Bacillus sp. AFS040349]UGB32608.1 inorganic phosphate transporter family protein [Metabacillus sp. B2-18]UPG63205.1 anion permease [Metabacillus endolithicus]
MLEIIAIIISFFFAMNIGASGAAASMGVAYGSGAILRPRNALILCGIGVILGAVIGGGEVVKTISSGIIPSSLISIKMVVIILFSATFSLFLSNLLGIPLSTSEVTVGSVVGVGIAYQALYVNNLLYIIMFWIIVPIVAFAIAFLFIKILHSFKLTQKYSFEGKVITYLLIFAGFFEAFSAGMNNVANAVGPLVSAGILTVSKGTLIGGVFVALGALLLGRRVLETNGKKITSFSKIEGVLISGTGATLVIVASIFGIPVPLTQITTSSILGIGIAKSGSNIFQQKIVKNMLMVWLISPLVSLTMSYFLVQLFIESDLYTIFVLASLLLATIGANTLMKASKQEKRAVHEEGGGI